MKNYLLNLWIVIKRLKFWRNHNFISHNHLYIELSQNVKNLLIGAGNCGHGEKCHYLVLLQPSSPLFLDKTRPPELLKLKISKYKVIKIRPN